MKSAADLRTQIEAELSSRIPSALTPRVREERTVVATGIAPIDDLLEGGLPTGAITEIIGPECSGRTTLAVAFVAQHTQAQRVCAWVDASDTLDPETAAASGVDLSRLLWVRCSDNLLSNRQNDSQSSSLAIDHKRIQLNSRHFGRRGLHPKDEEHCMSKAVEELFHSPTKHHQYDGIPGTPGTSNRNIAASVSASKTSTRKEQVSHDRLPPRRGSSLLSKGSSTIGRSTATNLPYDKSLLMSKKELAKFPISKRISLQDTNSSLLHYQHLSCDSQPWRGLKQALKSTDLLLQAGGFGAIVLDLGTIAPEAIARIPIATFFKLRAAADRNCTSLLILNQHSCAKSSAEVVLQMTADPPEKGTVITAMSFKTTLVRQRFKSPESAPPMNKPGKRAQQTKWTVPTTWARVR